MMRYRPWSFALAVREKFVAALRTVTVALGTAAPAESETVPLISAAFDCDCPKAVAAQKSRTINKQGI